jgi:hypothetical protein
MTFEWGKPVGGGGGKERVMGVCEYSMYENSIMKPTKNLRMKGRKKKGVRK